jgi:hypothetical protein
MNLVPPQKKGKQVLRFESYTPGQYMKASYIKFGQIKFVISIRNLSSYVQGKMEQK